MWTKESVLDFVVSNDVKFIKLQFCDIFGNLKNINITASQIERVLNEGISFNSSSIVGFANSLGSDLLLVPDVTTFVILPWRPQHGKVARLICDIRRIDGSPFDCDTRSILRTCSAHCKELGLTIQVNTECEFFLFKTDMDGNPILSPQDNAGYLDVSPYDMGENARRDICLTLEGMGFDVEFSHHESSPGQNQINFKNDCLIHAADNLITFKTVVKTISARNGLYASFMPKPMMTSSGSGLHLNFSLIKNGENLYLENGLSREAESFLEGMLRHIKNSSAVTNPLINSYKRFVDGFGAPTKIGWSAEEKSAVVKLDHYNQCFELRTPDAACNPYLCLALMTEAGLEGMRDLLPLSEDLSMDSSAAERMPDSLYGALLYMKEDPLVRSVLGETIFRQYLRAKLAEWNDYNTTVHQWEINKYLNVF